MPGCKLLSLYILINGIAVLSNPGLCQSHPVPASVTSQFASMFPNARNAEWRDKQTSFAVYFTKDNAKCEAKFDLNGKWLNTERQIKKDSLPEQIQRSLRAGTYADWNIRSVYVMTFADQPMQFHIIVTKDNSPDKILFIDKTGQIIKENPML